LVLVLSKMVSTVVFWLRDLSTFKEYLYGVSYDKVNFVFSDDQGLTWKAISKTEFDSVIILLFEFLSKL